MHLWIQKKVISCTPNTIVPELTQHFFQKKKKIAAFCFILRLSWQGQKRGINVGSCRLSLRTRFKQPSFFGLDF